MPSLSLAEAEQRATALTVERYDVDLDLTSDQDTFRSVTTIRFACSDPSIPTFVDVAPRTLTSAVLNGRELDLAALADCRLPLPALAPDNLLVVDAEMAYSRDGEGLHRAVDPADGRIYLYAMSFLDAAPRIFACFDQPDLKATYDVSVSTPAGWIVAGNGRATEVAPGRWRLATTKPLSTYVVTLVAGPYHTVHDEHDGIRLALHVKQSLAQHLDEQAGEILGVTKAAFDELHRLFGIRYPFGDYHQAFVPEFNAGAMENPGCVTFRDTMIYRTRATEAEHSARAGVIAHEMAHQWFGNLVTMRWWDDLWLNESFAEYMGYRVCDTATQFRDGWLEAAMARKRWGMTADARSTTHPVAGRSAVDAATALQNFDGISYAKGASALKQLVVHIGDDAFLAGVVRHLHAHAYGNATFADLLAAWTDAGAADLDHWAQEWLRTSGTDTLHARLDGATLELRCTPPEHHPANRPHTFWVSSVLDEGTHEQLVRLDGEPIEVDVPLGTTPFVIVDAHDDTWAKIRMDPQSLAAVPAMLPHIRDPLTRAVVWNSLRFAVDDAELDPTWMLETLESCLPRESGEIAVGSLLSWATHVVAGQYIPDPAAARRVAGIASAVLAIAPAGSSAQIVAARAVAASSNDAQTMMKWLRGRDIPDGLAVDAELRWALLTRLCALGAADEARIEAEMERDRSAQGLVHAARCRAALPTPAAKERAWSLLTRDPHAGNYILYATAEGFWQPGQLEVAAPYVERYFTEMPSTCELRRGWVVSQSLEYAYPHLAVDASTVALAERALAGHLEPGVRRAIADGTDDLCRALGVRERWRIGL
jgi:aminopeptidase N